MIIADHQQLHLCAIHSRQRLDFRRSSTTPLLKRSCSGSSASSSRRLFRGTLPMEVVQQRLQRECRRRLHQSLHKSTALTMSEPWPHPLANNEHLVVDLTQFGNPLVAFIFDHYEEAHSFSFSPSRSLALMSTYSSMHSCRHAIDRDFTNSFLSCDCFS